MRTILLAGSIAAATSFAMVAPAEACWRDCHRPERDGPWYTYQPWTNPGYFSGVTVRIHEPRYFYHARRHAPRHSQSQPLK